MHVLSSCYADCCCQFGVHVGLYIKTALAGRDRDNDSYCMSEVSQNDSRSLCSAISARSDLSLSFSLSLSYCLTVYSVSVTRCGNRACDTSRCLAIGCRLSVSRRHRSAATAAAGTLNDPPSIVTNICSGRHNIAVSTQCQFFDDKRSNVDCKAFDIKIMSLIILTEHTENLLNLLSNVK